MAGMVERYLMFFGDSHTAGVGDEEGLGWTGRVVAAALQEGIPTTSYNLGVGGETSADVAARWRAEARPRLPGAADAADARVVLAFGVNDVWPGEEGRACTQEQSLLALEEVLLGAQGLGLRRFVIGPAAVDDEAINDRIAELSYAYRMLCARHRVPFVSLIEELRGNELWRRAVAAGDGAHPGAGGYAEMARLVLAAGWLDWLRSGP
ncbi:MAG TPA: GDSL-type esterase/lipase family protein [Solirubrobacterales bacterium]|nr:GDSL-type esterase/lipase family protein [Solirubrobacterales bacterium]